MGQAAEAGASAGSDGGDVAVETGQRVIDDGTVDDEVGSEVPEGCAAAVESWGTAEVLGIGMPPED